MDLNKNMVYSGREKNLSEGDSWDLEHLSWGGVCVSMVLTNVKDGSESRASNRTGRVKMAPNRNSASVKAMCLDDQSPSS